MTGENAGDEKRAEQRAAIVTGGGSGIGRATALALAKDGARVAVADIDERRGRGAVELLEINGKNAVFVQTDVTRDSDCANLVETTLKHFGRLDIAFNNAGIVGYPALTADYGVAKWQRVIDVNLTGIFNCMTHELTHMKEHGGVIVNTASVMGLIGSVGGSAYCASKHGVIGLTKAAALEYGRSGVRINAICPGYVSTDMTVGDRSLFTPEKLQEGIKKTAINRLASPEEIAEIVVWLCSDRASYVTGGIYTIDGGFTAG